MALVLSKYMVQKDVLHHEGTPEVCLVQTWDMEGF